MDYTGNGSVKWMKEENGRMSTLKKAARTTGS
jgi:hypothetical protein